MIMLKLLKLIRRESLARARRRVKRSIKNSANKLIFRSILREGEFGYKRERSIYEN